MRPKLYWGKLVGPTTRPASPHFYERTALSRNKAAMLKKGQKAIPEDSVTPEEEVKDPLVLEFLGLKDEYSENDLEEALICHLEKFLLELGNDFTFVARQKRLHADWYRIDLLFFHRRLRCLVIIDLKIGRFTHADARANESLCQLCPRALDAGQRESPVGLILCSQKNKNSGPLCPDEPHEQSSGERVSTHPPQRETAGRGNRQNPQSAGRNTTTSDGGKPELNADAAQQAPKERGEKAQLSGFRNSVLPHLCCSGGFRRRLSL